MERWDAYLSDGTKAGCDLVRGGENPKHYYHLVAEVLVRHKDGTYLVMTRDPEKKNHGGMLEASAGGAVRKGETSETGARRELFEETGIRAETLTLFRRWSEPWYPLLFDYYLTETDAPKGSVTLQEGETVAYAWVTEAELRDIIAQKKVVHWDYLQEIFSAEKRTQTN